MTEEIKDSQEAVEQSVTYSCLSDKLFLRVVSSYIDRFFHGGRLIHLFPVSLHQLFGLDQLCC